MSDYFVLRIESVSDAAESWLAEAAFACGALGMSEALPFEQPEGEEDVFVRRPAERTVDVYFERPPGPDFVSDLQARFPYAQVRLTGEKNRDWLSEWKKGFKPFPLTETIWVVPSWFETPQEAKIALRVDPGMAFGTGTHETTRLVACEMAALLKSHIPRSVLDVGTGTGLLAILAAKLGVPRVDATEIEEDSRRVAHENFRQNAVTVRLDEKQVGDLNEKYDWVLANIIDGVLVRIQEDLKARVRPGGWLLVSGIIGEREEFFLNEFKLPDGTDWTIRREDGDWRLFGAQFPGN